MMSARGAKIFQPKSSMPIIHEAYGVFVVPAKNAIMEMPVNKVTGAARNHAIEFPRAAPIKKSGVTSPPLKPAASVMMVNANFHNHALAGAWMSDEKNPVRVSDDLFSAKTPSPK